MGLDKRKCTLIGTHNGQFHCDEVLACYMLKRLPAYEHCQIKRTRDASVLNECDIVVDVGAVYDHEKQRYDHHQRDFKTTLSDIWPDVKFRTKLSSAGLVYAHYGHSILRAILSAEKVAMKDDDLNLLFKKVYENFIEEIDAVDNGMSVTDSGKTNYLITTTISSRVAFLNPNWTEENSESIAFERFEKAMSMVGAEFEARVIHYAIVWLPAREIVKTALLGRLQYHKSGKILVFQDVCPPWKDHLFTLELELKTEEILYVIYQDSMNKSWRIQCVPISEGSFLSRKALPEAWRGIRDENLSEISGVPKSVFVHASGFIGGNETFEGVLKMAVLSLEM